MIQTFSERLIDAMDNGPHKISGTALAKKCRVAQPSVSDWRSGKSKSMGAEALIEACDLLGVNPRWLATGKGPKRPAAANGNNTTEEPAAPFTVKEQAHAALENLPETAMPEALVFLEFLSEKVKKNQTGKAQKCCYSRCTQKGSLIWGSSARSRHFPRQRSGTITF